MVLRCARCNGIIDQMDFENVCRCREKEERDALAKAIAEEIFKRLPKDLEFRTYQQAGDAAEVYGNYVTILSLVEDEDG